jgi:FAD/FMN-containing dehydrogenase
LLQGQHGYALDNLISARVVLASGELVQASATTNADLFWALKGAGHNFGILTSLEVKVHDVQSNWTVHSFAFASDQLEDLFSLVNRLEEPTSNRSANLALTGVFTRIPAVDPVNVGHPSFVQQYSHLHRLACHSIQRDLPRHRVECRALCSSV